MRKPSPSTLHPSAPKCFKSLYYEETQHSNATIKCDFDKRNPISLRKVSSVVRYLHGSKFCIYKIMVFTTRKGHHLRAWVACKEKRLMPARLTLRIQSTMGDDPMRQRFNAARVRRGEKHWNVLWNKKIRNGKVVSEEVLNTELTKRLQAVI